MASSGPHKVFLVTEILEMILLETDMQTLLTSAQRVCRQWSTLIENSADLQCALFFRPVKYRLPRGELGIRNPLLADCIWPFFCARHAHRYGAPPVEGGAKIPTFDPRDIERLFREGATWKRMLFQQPPRSCIGLVEKDGKAVDGPAYTEVKVWPYEDYLRIGDIIFSDEDRVHRHDEPLGRCHLMHPLPEEEGLIWYGRILTKEEKKWIPSIPASVRYWEIPQSQVMYATSTYLQDCDVVFFILECGRARNQFVGEYAYNYPAAVLNRWLRDMRMSLVPGQISVPVREG